MTEVVKDIKSVALQMEMDGIAFYTDLANKTFHPMGKAMFKSFIEDEKLHAKRLRLLLSAHNGPVHLKEDNTGDPREKLLSIFREMGEELKKEVHANTNDIEAVKLAIEMEESGVRFYEEAVGKVIDKRDKEVYRFLAGEEKMHYRMLKNTLEYLEKMALQQAENEGRIYDMWASIINDNSSDRCRGR